ncbi:MAG: polysaccharide deacetylase [Halobacteriales archaeon]
MHWKDDANCAVVLTFDVDGKQMWRGRVERGLEGFDKPPVMSMGEYGTDVAVPRILELLEEYDLPAGFFIPGKIAEENPAMVEAIADAGHEIAHHSYAHTNPTTMTDAEEQADFERANAVFEDLIGETPVGYRSPAGDLGDRTLTRMVEMGFEYESSMMGNDVPYVVDTEAGPLVELPFHWSTDDAPFFNFNMGPEVSYQSGMSSPSTVYDIWSTEFDACYDRGLLLNLAMHPQIIGRPHRMEMLEDLIQYMLGHSDVWITTPRAVARHFREQQSLE